MLSNLSAAIKHSDACSNYQHQSQQGVISTTSHMFPLVSVHRLLDTVVASMHDRPLTLQLNDHRWNTSSLCCICCAGKKEGGAPKGGGRKAAASAEPESPATGRKGDGRDAGRAAKIDEGAHSSQCCCSTNGLTPATNNTRRPLVDTSTGSICVRLAHPHKHGMCDLCGYVGCSLLRVLSYNRC
jgi:hypothetical protein